MWLLNTQTLMLEAFLGDVPSYAILSHRWEDEELSFGDVTPEHQHLKGYRKVKAFCEEAKRNNFQYAWADTCCIDKKSSAELGEAINSMYMWYERADICYAYLCDVKGRDDVAQSSWFTRGWTLQELLAPTRLHFYDSGWSLIASKYELLIELEGITGIPQLALHNFRHDDFCIAEKMAWAARRHTTREEDSAYCLLGLFNANMPLLYGEGSKAFVRFQEEIMKVNTDLSILLWQGRASPTNGMLAATPSCFERNDNRLDLVTYKEVFNIPSGWITNNAGTDIELHVFPYLLTPIDQKVFIACLHDADGIRDAKHGIFIEELRRFGTRAKPFYRRVTVDGKAWTEIKFPYQDRLGSRQQLFITRQPLLGHSMAHAFREFHVALELPLSAKRTARYGLLANLHYPLIDGPVLPAADQSEAGYCFRLDPSTDLNLCGHIVIALAHGVEILVGFGFDRAFCAICFVLPLCTTLYKSYGHAMWFDRCLTSGRVLNGVEKLKRAPDGRRGRESDTDMSCELFCM